jgi:hypothetical protein
VALGVAEATAMTPMTAVALWAAEALESSEAEADPVGSRSASSDWTTTNEGGLTGDTWHHLT